MTLPTRTLRQGSQGQDVVTLQNLLNDALPSPLGLFLATDGDFGPATWQAVVAFQNRKFLTPDGVVGPKTWAAFAGGDTISGTVPPALARPPSGPNAPPPPPTPPAPPSGGGASPLPPRPPLADPPTPTGPVRGRMVLRRTGVVGTDGGYLGELTIGGKSWATVERGEGYTSVRQGTYLLVMNMKGGKNARPAIRFYEHDAIKKVLWHDAAADSCKYLKGCIAPGILTADGQGITKSRESMGEVFLALGGYAVGALVLCEVQNNAPGKGGSKMDWIRQRAAAQGLPYP